MNNYLCMFTHFIYKHITFYKNFALTITKVKKHKKCQEGGKNVKKLYPTKNYDTYECIFWNVYPFHIGKYDIL